MKSTIVIAVIFLFVINTSQGQDVTAQTQANLIAQRMKDTLSLTDLQRSQIADATVSMQTDRIKLKDQFEGSKGLIYYLRMVEEKRDSLYKPILSDEKFIQYMLKKPVLTTVD